MGYQCPKGHLSSDPDYCSECGAKIGQSPSPEVSTSGRDAAEEICPDCGTPRAGNGRFCEVCRYDFTDGKTVTAEKVVSSGETQAAPQEDKSKDSKTPEPDMEETEPKEKDASLASIPLSNVISKEEIIIGDKLNIIIYTDTERLAQNQAETNYKPDSVERIFPLDLDENLVGRRSEQKGIYPEIEINDPGVSHRHLKFIKQPDGSFAVLELGSANGTEYNGAQLAAGVVTPVKPGDIFSIGLWTTLNIASR